LRNLKRQLKKNDGQITGSFCGLSKKGWQVFRLLNWQAFAAFLLLQSDAALFYDMVF